MDLDTAQGTGTASIPLWVYWHQIANRHAHLAEQAHARAIADVAVARPTQQPGQVEIGPDGNDEMVEAMIAITAAANALDAVYGSLKTLVRYDGASQPKRSNTSKRSHQIVEILKRGFQIGKYAKDWTADLDWLFALRNRIVHHSEEPRPLQIAAADDERIVLSASEAYDLTAASARRSAEIVETVMRTCLDKPKAGTRIWSDRAVRLREGMGSLPGTTGERPVSLMASQTGDVLHITASSLTT